MCTNMLGRLPLSEIQGPRDDFEQKLAGDEGKLWLNQFNRFLRKETCWVKNEATIGSSPKPRSLLRLLTPGLIIPATDGTEDLNDPKVFTGWVDPDLKRYGCNGVSEAKPETAVAVYELIEDGDFQKIFGSQGVDLDQLCLTPHQIKQFVVSHREYLHSKGWATFFLFKANGGQFFVASVFWDGIRRLEMNVYRFSHGSVWYAGNRFRVVLPQLTL